MQANAVGRDAEDLGDPAQEALLGVVIAAVRDGDVEQALENVLEHARPAAEHPGDARGVGVETGDVLAGEVEHARRRRFVLGRDLEDLAEGRDLGRRSRGRRPWPSSRRG